MATIAYVLSHEQFSPPELIENGVAAERAGFDALWTSDHFHPWMDNQGHAGFAWATLAALGQRTSVPLGTGVTCPSYRYNPAIVAQAFATLGVLYPGRVFLGVGSGEALNEAPSGGGWDEYTDRAERFVESVQLIRKLWSGEWVTHEGEHFRVKDAKLYDLPEQPVPIYMAASGPNSLREVGKHGDGLITDTKTAMSEELRQTLADGAREAGRELASMPVLVEQFVVVGGQKEAEKAARLWRFIPNAWTDFVNNPDPRDIQRRAEAELSLEDVYSQWVVSEDPREHASAIRELLDAGVDQVYVHSGQMDQQRVIEFYGEKVLPLLQG